MDNRTLNIPGFELEGRIGEGELTEIWQARQVSLDRKVSIRLLKPHAAANEEERRIFVADAQAAANLQHPGIVRVYDVREHDGLCFFVMEYAGGKTVLDLLQQHGALPASDALAIATRVAEALRFAWGHYRVVHKNIKPSSIRMADDGTVKLTYLGLSLRPPNALRTPTGTVVVEGTPHYMAPEQASASPFDFRADMYALGATLYHMLTGRVPFAASDPAEAMRRHISDHLPNPADIVPSLSPAAAAFVARLMMKDPADRFSRWGQVIEAIEKLNSGRLVIAKQRQGAISTIAPPGARRTPGIRLRRPQRT
jgi:serine/threonine protein kinase